MQAANPGVRPLWIPSKRTYVGIPPLPHCPRGPPVLPHPRLTSKWLSLYPTATGGLTPSLSFVWKNAEDHSEEEELRAAKGVKVQFKLMGRNLHPSPEPLSCTSGHCLYKLNQEALIFASLPCTLVSLSPRSDPELSSLISWLITLISRTWGPS